MLATLVVTSMADAGPGSLRQAIVDANSTVAKDEIQFNVLSPNVVIRPLTKLPEITSPLQIDATTQPGYAGSPVVTLDGSLIAEQSVSGLELQTTQSRIAGLAIHSFSGNGIVVSGGSNNIIEGNYVGLDAQESPLANGLMGIRITNSANNRIGTPALGNLISGNTQAGINVAGDFSTGNRIQGNQIGTGANGESAMGNEDGVLISFGASSTIVGTDGDGIDDASERNLISGNNRFGIRISEASSNIVAGNWIGLNQPGNTSIPNGEDGVYIDTSSSMNLIGSDADGQSDDLERNVISGNVRDGIIIRDNSARNIVSGNYIGTTPDGNSPLPNTLSAVSMWQGATENLIGTQDGQYIGNLLSGNLGNGVWIGNSHSNTVSGNLVGVNAEGNAALPNMGRGVTITRGSTLNRIGTNDNGNSDASERNVVSGNRNQGILINEPGTNENVVSGNFIGTDLTGQSRVPNTSTGILISNQAARNIIGTTEQSREGTVAGNLVSGNEFYGVRFRNAATQNSLKGNFIGTDVTGQFSLQNGSGGVSTFEAAINNTIGGATEKERNIISGNSNWGIYIQANSGENLVQGNWIGLANDGTTAVGNSLGGILIEDASRNSIGGAATASNTIAYNGTTGIAIQGDLSIENSITQNSIFGHSLVGLDLGGDGPSPNDVLDLDSGPNLLQNYPVPTHLLIGSGRTFVAGEIASVPNSRIRVELFLSRDGVGVGEGREFVESTHVQTNDKGLAYWAMEIASPSPESTLTATATDMRGNTSEFSPALPASTLYALDAAADVNEAAGVLTVSVSRGETPLSQSVTFNITTSDSLQATPVQSTVVIPAGQVSTRFDIQIIDDSIVEDDVNIVIYATRLDGPGAGVWQSRIIDNDQDAWHNNYQPEDTNGDRFVSAIDALVVINFLNSEMQTNLSQRDPLSPSLFVDVNNDGTASPLDALLVINFLNRAGNGEASDSAEEYFQSLDDDMLAAEQWYWLEDLLSDRLKLRANGLRQPG